MGCVAGANLDARHGRLVRPVVDVRNSGRADMRMSGIPQQPSSLPPLRMALAAPDWAPRQAGEALARKFIRLTRLHGLFCPIGSVSSGRRIAVLVEIE